MPSTCEERQSGGRNLLLIGLLWVAGSVAPNYGQKDLLFLREQFTLGNYQEVLNSVREARAARTASADGLFLGSEAALFLGDEETAQILASDGLRLEPKSALGHQLLGHSAWAAAERQEQKSAMTRLTYRDAGLHYRDARIHGADPFESAYFAAKAFEKGGDLGAALEEIDLALAARPGHEPSLLEKATYLAGLGEREASKVILRRLLPGALGPRAAVVLLTQTMEKEPRETVAREFLALQKQFPSHLPLYQLVLEHFGRDSRADVLESLLRKALDQVPPSKDRLPLWYLAGIAQAAGRADEALALYTEYRDLNPSQGDGHLGVGYALAYLRRYEAARESFERAEILGGADEAALDSGLELLVVSMVGEERFAPAAEVQRHLARRRDRPLDQLDLGSLLYNAGRREEALKVYAALLERTDYPLEFRARVLNYQGLAFQGLGQNEAAESCFRESLESALAGRSDAAENLGVLLLARGDRAQAREVLSEPATLGRLRARYHLLRSNHPSLFGL